MVSNSHREFQMKLLFHLLKTQRQNQSDELFLRNNLLSPSFWTIVLVTNCPWWWPHWQDEVTQISLLSSWQINVFQQKSRKFDFDMEDTQNIDFISTPRSLNRFLISRTGFLKVQKIPDKHFHNTSPPAQHLTQKITASSLKLGSPISTITKIVLQKIRSCENILSYFSCLRILPVVF